MASTFIEERQIPLTYFGDLTNQRASIEEADISASNSKPFGERNSVSSSSKKLTNVVPKRKKAASHLTSPAKITSKNNFNNNNTFTYDTQTKNSTTIKNSIRNTGIST